MQEKIVDIVTYHTDFIASKIYYFGPSNYWQQRIPNIFLTPNS
jgi:hypothetical protein